MPASLMHEVDRGLRSRTGPLTLRHAAGGAGGQLHWQRRTGGQGGTGHQSERSWRCWRSRRSAGLIGHGGTGGPAGTPAALVGNCIGNGAPGGRAGPVTSPNGLGGAGGAPRDASRRHPTGTHPPGPARPSSWPSTSTGLIVPWPAMAAAGRSNGGYQAVDPAMPAAATPPGPTHQVRLVPRAGQALRPA